jgi:peptidoglycan/LPS O-acetylase OafA/YrhL
VQPVRSDAFARYATPGTELQSGPREVLVPAAARRLEYIDGLRALAALWVALHHVIETSIPERALHTPVLGAALASLFFGQFPVMVFLMLSGFCLYYPYVRKNPRPAFAGFGAFVARRAQRIAPPYLGAGAFCLMMAAFPQLQVGRWTVTGPIDAKVVFSHLLFVHNLIPSHAIKIDYPMWSIGLEWQLYLLFPLMVWGFRRSNGVVVIGLTLALAILVRAGFRGLPENVTAALRFAPVLYLEIFAAGMLAAALTVRGGVRAPKWLLGAVAVVGMTLVRLGTGGGLLHDVATSSAAFCVLLLAVDATSATSRFLSHPWLVRLGFFSYSIYLMHAPLVHLVWFALGPLHLTADAMFVALILSLPLIVWLTYVFHLAFERPFMRVKKAHAPSPAVQTQSAA